MINIIKAVQKAVGVNPDGDPGSKTWNAIAAKLNVQITQEYNELNLFNGIRSITGKLDQVQVDSIKALIAKTGHWNIGWVAYALATAWHESRLRPIKEAGSNAYLSKYDTGKLALALGNTPEADGDGILYAGRGFVQLTGKANYTKASKYLNLPLLEKPDLALELNNAVAILVWGMEEGIFTGKALKHYIFNDVGTTTEFTNARRIINGTDRAALIAGYANQFQNVLLKAKL